MDENEKMLQAELAQRANAEDVMLAVYNESERQREQEPAKIGAEQIRKAAEILRKYKEGKKHLEDKIIANEEFWKLRQWNYIHTPSDDFEPATAWLWSCIQSRYSDVMDSYPTCNMQPRQQDDKEEARKLSSIVPVILAQNNYEETYSDIAWYTLKHGGSVQGVFWDGSLHNGIGDIAIKKIDFINLFWQPGITDIQKSANVFNTELVDNELLEQRYPECKGHLNGKNITLSKYLYDDNVDTSEKSVVVDWYYHTEYNGRRVLQYVKFVNDVVLYATENETKRPVKQSIDPQTGRSIVTPAGESMAERGLYDHGLYPFVVQALFPVEGSICGYGLTDIGRDTQIQIDLINKAVTENAILGASPRYFTKSNGAINEEEFTDRSKKLVHVEGSVDDTNIRPIERYTLDSVYVTMLQEKINELKQCTSNQDSNNGIAPSGITAASAIAALQEAAGKNARSSNRTFYRAYKNVIYQVIELIRQFYDIPRQFRICPDDIGEQFVTYSNTGIAPQKMTGQNGQDMGLRKPEFDIDVTTEKANPYKKMEINELAMNFYNSGFFNPQLADQALSCLSMMDFTRKEDVINRIKQNGTMQQLLIQYQQLALQLAQKIDQTLAQQIADNIMQSNGQAGTVPAGGAVSFDTANQEHPFVENARNQAESSTQVG